MNLSNYLSLIRLPNIFTIPSNIILGFFLINGFNVDIFPNLVLLIASSILIYVSGIVFNDYFDFYIDKKERPNRPIPSGKISRKNALYFGISTIVISFILSLSVHINSVFILIIILILSIGYNHSLKKTNFGPLIMGTIRTMNIILGASPFLDQINDYDDVIKIIIVTSSILFYIISLSILSKYEVSKDYNFRILIPSALLLITIFVIISLSIYLDIFLIESILLMLIFASAIGYTYIKLIFKEKSIQNTVQNMIICITLLDSIFITGIIGLYLGIFVALLIIPNLILAKKYYMT